MIGKKIIKQCDTPKGLELILPLKKQWYKMIKDGVKKEEYREITEYWIKRLTNGTPFSMKTFDLVTFTLGYPRKDDTERRLTFKHPKIRIGYGKEEWGAVKGKQYFIITWE